MRHNTPPLNALKAFEAAARTGSYTQASKELFVTSGAISQQVANLEKILGVKLFSRKGSKLSLTQVGKKYQLRLTEAFDKLEMATTELFTSQRREHILNVGVLPMFSAKILVPALSNYLKDNPEFKIQLTTLRVDFATDKTYQELRERQIDLGIYFGNGNWPGLHSSKLLGEELIAVAARSLVGAGSRQVCPEDILGLPILYHGIRPDTWHQWFANFLPEATLPSGSIFEQFSMLFEAAKAGLGVCLLPKYAVLDELKRGELIQIHSYSLQTQNSYYAVFEEGKDAEPKFSAFLEWLRREISTMDS